MNNDASNPGSPSNDQGFKIFIDPLQGYVFGLSVQPEDNILTLKTKIEELKGVPVNQQKLLLNFKELEDTATLEELSITNQTTLQLVLSLHSGPVSTIRKIIPAMNSSHFKDLIIHHRKEIGSLQPGTKLSIMVFRDGTKVKMFKMLEKIDSSIVLDPLVGTSSRSSSGKQLMVKSQRIKYYEDPKIVQKVKLIKAKLVEQKNSRKKAVVSNENQSPFMNQILNENVAPAKKKLPPLSSTLMIKEELSPRTKVEFPQVPVLPNIGPNTFPSCHAPFSEVSTASKLRSVSDKSPMNDGEICDSSQKCKPEEINSSANKRRSSLVSQRDNLFPDRSTGNDDSKFKLQLKPPVVRKLGKKLISSPNEDAAEKQPLAEERINSFLSDTKNSGFLSCRNPVWNFGIEDCVPAKKHLSTVPAELPEFELPFDEDISHSKKKSKNRCSECRKKLTISNMYECRCGLLFCSTHRYSEAHSCSFDYKTEGRKLIKKVNPLVVAPKLPKI